MQFQGQDINMQARGTVTIPKPTGSMVLTVEAYPLGYDTDEFLPMPTPPKKAVRKAGKSSPILRDETGRPLYDFDETDSKYREQYNRMFWLRLAADFYHATKPCGQFSYAADASDLDPAVDPEDFYSAVYEELKVARFSNGDLKLVIDKTRALSNMGDLEEAAENFSSQSDNPRGSADSGDVCEKDAQKTT